MYKAHLSREVYKEYLCWWQNCSVLHLNTGTGTAGVHQLWGSTVNQTRVRGTVSAVYGEHTEISHQAIRMAYLHQVGHDLHYLFHRGPLGRVFGPAAGHQTLNGLGQILDQWWTGACRPNTNPLLNLMFKDILENLYH